MSEIKDEPAFPTNQDAAKYCEELFESGRYLGMVVAVFSKGGEGPEGILCESFQDVGGVPNIGDKMRALAAELSKGEE
jgi:hypothetical protein